MFLKVGVVAEPLFCQWFAWPALISPITAAMYIRKHYLPVLESYVEEPELHAAAARNVAMRAGPFLDHRGDYAAMVEFLALAKTKLAHLVELSEAIDKTNGMLASLGGLNSESIYARMPSQLRGLVELVYDLNHSPSIRFIEPLLYNSSFFTPSLQSVRLRSIVEHDRRFALNTPMLDDQGPIVDVPFTSRFIDLIGRARFQSIDRAELLNEIPEHASTRSRVMELFTEEAPPRRPTREPDGSAPHVRYFGHGTVLFQIGGTSILTDPCISSAMPAGVRDRFHHADLPEKIDLVLITHGHQDHVLLDTLLQLRSRIKTIVVPRNAGGFLQDPSLKLMLEAIGFDNVVEISEMQKITRSAVEVVAVPFLGEHGELNIQSKVGYHIRSPELSALLLADSNVIDPAIYDGVHDRLGDVDVLFIGMDCVGAPYKWLYAPLYSQPLDHARGTGRRINGSDCRKAMEIVRRFKPRAAYSYAMGVEPWISHITGADTAEDSPQALEAGRFASECRALGIVADSLYWSSDVVF